MAFLKVDNAAVIKEGSGSNYIKTSGIYPIKLNACEIASTQNGATQANYYADKIMAFGQIVANREGKTTDKNGKKLSGYGVIEALAAVVGEEELGDPESTSVKFSKGNKDLMCIPELTGVEVKVYVQFEYQKYKGQIKERINIKRFYREDDNASGTEILAALQAKEDGTELEDRYLPGTQYAKDEKYAAEVKYTDSEKGAGDAPTEAEVAAWKKAQAGGSNGSSTDAPASKPKGAGKAFPGTAS